MEFLSTLLNQDIEANYRPKAPCTCSSFSKLTNNKEASRLGNSQEEQNATPNNYLYQLGQHRHTNDQEDRKCKKGWR